MHRILNRFFFLCFLFILGCGSGNKLTQNPQPLGFVPFGGSSLSPDAEILNNHVLRAFRNSGSFEIEILDSIPTYWSLDRMKSAPAEAPTWILTGNFDFEREYEERGSKVPYLVYKPRTTIAVRLTYRLFNKDEQKWQDIGEIDAKSSQSADWQFVEYDQADPSLALNPTEQEYLRLQAYQKATEKLIGIVEKKMVIEK